MVVIDDLQVRILVDRALAREYERPDEPNIPGHATRFIRAEPGQSLAVEVSVVAGFDLKYAPYLVVKLYCDGFGKATLRKCNTERILHDDEQIVTCGGRIALFETCRTKDDRTGQWFKCRYTFQDLESSKSPFHIHSRRISSDRNSSASEGIPAATLNSIEAEDLGSIRISICRALRVPVAPRERKGLRRREVDRVSEQDLDGRNLTSSIQRVVEGPAPIPPLKKYCYVPLPGSMGRKTRFTYYYRSKRESLYHSTQSHRSLLMRDRSSAVPRTDASHSFSA
jgi:hypothetical protein